MQEIYFTAYAQYTYQYRPKNRVNFFFFAD
jgi:hypothetical protein